MTFSTPVSGETLDMLTGKLLGDGCITKQNGRMPRFQFIHTTSDKEWCFHCYEKLMNDLPLTPPYYKKLKIIESLKALQNVSKYNLERIQLLLGWSLFGIVTA